MEHKIISIQEANKMLPLVRSIVNSIMKVWDAIQVARAELEAHQQDMKANPSLCKAKKEELNVLIDRVNLYIREIEDLGGFVEEFKRGIINFPSLYHGRKIFLCWMPSDVDVRFWHELDETMNDRVEIKGTSFLEAAPVSPGNKPAFKSFEC